MTSLYLVTVTNHYEVALLKIYAKKSRALACARRLFKGAPKDKLRMATVIEFSEKQRRTIFEVGCEWDGKAYAMFERRVKKEDHYDQKVIKSAFLVRNVFLGADTTT